MANEYFGSLVRRRILLIILLGVTSIIFFQLFRMQILEASDFENKSENNSVKKILHNAPRGIFYDRNSDILVSNKSLFTLEITPASYDEINEPLLEQFLQSDSGYIDQILTKNKRYSQFTPVRIKRGVNFEFIAWLEENSRYLQGVNYIAESVRDYSFGVNGSHIFGYTKEISQDQWENEKFRYDIRDYIGAKGIEKIYERYLRGRKGFEFVIVNSQRQIVGKYLDGSMDTEPEKGADLILTIDKDVQREAEKLFTGLKGALMAIEPLTGEVLAFVSAPEYDLSKFAEVTSQEEWDLFLKDENKPLFNRTTNSINPPGSTIKMLEALIALQEGIISPDYSIVCKGGINFGDRYFHCHEAHGRVNVVTAIEHSCNTFFYELILKIGLDRWADYLRQFGFGKKTNIDLPEESEGIVPDSDYYDKVYGKGKWTQGYLLNLGIGQGELSVTMAQLAQYTALLANFGETKLPHLVRGYVDPDTKQISNFNYDDIKVNIDRKYFDLVRRGMYLVVEGEGTAAHIRIPGVKMAGKTGTSQNPHGEDHALFVGFAPFDNPQIAVAVMVENVGFGGAFAAPIAREVIKTYLEKTKSDKSSTGREQ